MTPVRHMRKIGVLLFIMVFMGLTACDSVISIMGGDEYKDKRYANSTIDTVICNMYNDTLYHAVRPLNQYDLAETWNTDFLIPDDSWIVFSDTQWVQQGAPPVQVHPTDEWILLPDSTWLFPYDSVFTVGGDTLEFPSDEWDGLFDGQDVESIKANLITSTLTSVYDTLVSDSLYGAIQELNLLISPQTNLHNAVIVQPEISGAHVIAADNFVDFSVYSPTGEETFAQSSSVPLDAINGCYATKTRRIFTLDSGNSYLVQVAKTDQTTHTGTQDTLRLIIVPESN